MAQTHPASWDTNVLLEACDLQTTRRGGPGGQHRNKVETAVVITHRPTGLQASASERRSQVQNRSMAIQRLRLKLAIALRSDRSLEQPPSEAMLSRCRGGRLSISTTHETYPAILAEILDVTQACGYDPRKAAAWLGCTASQWIKCLKREPDALAWVNQQRAATQRKPLL